MSTKQAKSSGEKPGLVRIDQTSESLSPRDKPSRASAASTITAPAPTPAGAKPVPLQVVSTNHAPAMTLTEVVSQAETLLNQQQRDAAERVYATWLAQGHTGGRHLVLFNHAAVLQQVGKPLEAMNAYKEAMAIQPDFGQAYVNLGLMLERLGKTDEAIHVWAQFIARRHANPKLDPQLICTALNHIGRAQEGNKNYKQAAAAMRESLTIDPKQSGVIQHWVHIRQKACEWPVYQALGDISEGEMVRCTSPLAMLALTDDPLHQFATAQAFVNRTYALKETWIRGKAPLEAKPKLKVGLVSGDFRQHAVGFLLPSLLRDIDRNRYELIAFDFSKNEVSDTRAEIVSLFDKFLSIHNVSDQKAAEGIAHEQIDILIDLHGLSSGARPEIFSYHPAPIQVTYLGYIGTTTLPWFDYVIADEQVLPAELAGYFTEKPVYMKGSLIPLTYETIADGQERREDLGLPTDGFVMAAFSNVYKITQTMFDCWLQILRDTPDACLWLIDDNSETTQNLKRYTAEQGVDPARVVYMPRCDHETFKMRLKLADIYLDTYPYNCGSTSNDVVNAGLPLVSMYGETMVSRMGLSILSELDRSEWACANAFDYRATVAELHYKHQQGFKSHYAAQAHDKLGGVLDQLRSAQTKAPTSSTTQAPHPHEISEIAHNSLNLWDLHREIEVMLCNNRLSQHTAISIIDAALCPSDGLLQTLARADVAHQVIAWAQPQPQTKGLNPILAASETQPELLPLFEDFLAHTGLSLDVRQWCLPAHYALHRTGFTAPKWFWIQWLQMAQCLRAFVAAREQAPSEACVQAIYDVLANLIFVRTPHLPVTPSQVKPLQHLQLADEALRLEASKLSYHHTVNPAFLLQSEAAAEQTED